MELSWIEIILIFLIALLVLGPDEMIKHAVNVGKFVAKVRTQINNFKVMTQDELIKRAELHELNELKELTSLRDTVEKIGSDLSRSASSAGFDLNSKVNFSGHLKSVVDSTVVQVTETVKESDIESALSKLPSKISTKKGSGR